MYYNILYVCIVYVVYRVPPKCPLFIFGITQSKMKRFQ